MRLIDADKLIEFIKRDMALVKIVGLRVGKVNVREIFSYIDRAPTFEFKHGHWTQICTSQYPGETIEHKRLRCSVCMGRVRISIHERYSFCPYCGSKMKE